ncbi:hypothetical protein [Treponema sp.]|uniref:hypothetical protein n=1 Tax=Treponema sp. TaxID=166 RepID=UPI0025FB578D|nr:hypothetical protein [Treponema sp.]MCR5217577.1 hypothetical protein [Treponema sp.]
MKKIALVLLSFVAASMSFAQTKISQYSPKDVKKSEAKTFVTDEESYKLYQEKSKEAALTTDPFITKCASIGNEEAFVYAIAETGDNLSEELERFSMRVDDQSGSFLDLYNEKGYSEIDFTINFPKKAFKPFSKLGVNINLPVTTGFFALSNSKDDEKNVDITLDFDYESELAMDMKKFLAKEASSSAYKDLKIAMGATGKVYINADKSCLEDGVDFEELLTYINSSNVDVKFVFYVGTSVNIDGVGGKGLMDFTIAYKGSLNKNVINKFKAAYEDFMAIVNGDSKDPAAIREFPGTVHCGFTMYNDKNVETYVVYDESDPYAMVIKFKEALEKAQSVVAQ